MKTVQLRNFPFCEGTYYVKKVAFHIKMAHKIKNINELLDTIKSEATGFGLRGIASQVSQNPLTNSIPDRDTGSVLSSGLWEWNVMYLELWTR